MPLLASLTRRRPAAAIFFPTTAAVLFENAAMRVSLGLAENARDIVLP